jgi:hypothetical protein
VIYESPSFWGANPLSAYFYRMCEFLQYLFRIVILACAYDKWSLAKKGVNLGIT